MECTNVLLAHVADVLVVLKQTSDDDDMSSGCHGEDHLVSDIESDGVDDDEDSGGEESVSHSIYLLCVYVALNQCFNRSSITVRNLKLAWSCDGGVYNRVM